MPDDLPFAPPAETLVTSQRLAELADILAGAVSRANPTIICAKMPLSLHRFQRLYKVLCGPYSFGASRQCKPLRFMKIIPLRTRRSSKRGLACDFAKKGSRRAICASLSQKRSHMSPLVIRTVNHASKRKSMGPDPKEFGERL